VALTRRSQVRRAAPARAGAAPSPGRGPGALRIGAGVGALLLFCALAALLSRGAPAPWAALCGVAFTLPLCSLGEWLVHRVLYHARVPGLGLLRRIHQHGHHVALFPPGRYVQSGPYPFMRVRAPLLPFRMAESALDSRLTEWSQVGLHAAAGVPLVLLPAWALSGRPAFLAACGLTLALVSFALAHVHGAMHTPRGRWIEDRRWFRWLDRRHYLHHVDMKANLNFMLPLCDLLFGTQRARLTPTEAARVPSFEQAHTPGGARR
jgi:hypothetical protein